MSKYESASNFLNIAFQSVLRPFLNSGWIKHENIYFFCNIMFERFQDSLQAQWTGKKENVDFGRGREGGRGPPKSKIRKSWSHSFGNVLSRLLPGCWQVSQCRFVSRQAWDLPIVANAKRGPELSFKPYTTFQLQIPTKISAPEISKILVKNGQNCHKIRFY